MLSLMSAVVVFAAVAVQCKATFVPVKMLPMNHSMLILLCLLCAPQRCHGLVDFSNMTRRAVLDKLLNNEQYDPRIPPDFDKDVATAVTIQMHIVSFHSVNEMSMDYTMTFYLRRSWMDERLAFPTFLKSEVLELDTHLVDKLWVPDIFFRNEKSASVHNVTVPNRLLHLHRNGTVLYSSRLSMTLSCPMDLNLFPMDTQVCPIIIQSYAFSTSNVVFRWQDFPRSITMSEGWEASGHFFESGIKTLPCGNLFEDTYACVMATFQLQRNFGYFLVHVYLPTVLVVILSWIGFWIDVGATPARITIGVMSVLTMATQSSGAQALLPRVSYIKAIDVWMAVCVAFVFASLLEFAYVNVLNRRHQVYRRIMDDLRKRRETEDACIDSQGVIVDTSKCLDGVVGRGPDPRRVDKISRWAFPSCFTVFGIAYWVAYGAMASMASSVASAG